jgi:hypothetical protein
LDTDRLRQDKKPHVAALMVDCFDYGFSDFLHVALRHRNVRSFIFANYFSKKIAHCRRRRHESRRRFPRPAWPYPFVEMQRAKSTATTTALTRSGPWRWPQTKQRYNQAKKRKGGGAGKEKPQNAVSTPACYVTGPFQMPNLSICFAISLRLRFRMKLLINFLPPRQRRR